MCTEIHREITPLKENDCFLVLDRERNLFNYPIHFHPEYEINFIRHAKGAKRIVGDHIGEINEVELVMVGPNLYHGWENYNNNINEPLHEITVQFSQELFSDNTLNKNILKPIQELFANSSRGVLFSIETIKAMEPRLISLSKKKGFEGFLELQSILYDLAISKDRVFLTNTSFQCSNDFYNSERIKKIYEYISKNCSEKLMLEDTAHVVNMSAISFSRLVKQRTGRSFVDFVNEIRLGYATRHLIESNMSVSEISYLCGFNNLSNFNRIFKKRQGCTPSEFRSNFTNYKQVS